MSFRPSSPRRSLHSRTPKVERGAHSTPPALAVFAFGRPGYAYAAANLAVSTKHHTPQAKVHLYIARDLLTKMPDFHLRKFDSVTVLPEDSYTTGQNVDPGKLKCHLYEHLSEGPVLYVDADTLTLSDVQPLWDELTEGARWFVTDVADMGPPSGEVRYTPWASPKAIAEKIGNDGCTVYGINTSWMFIDKRPGTEMFFNRVAEHHDGQTWKRSELDHQWGKSIPDELIYGTTCSELGINPSGPRPMHFGHKYEVPVSELSKRFVFQSLYGNGRGKPLVNRRYLDLYDPYLKAWYQQAGGLHMFKLNTVLRDKYLG